MITTNNEELAKKAKAYRNYGKVENGDYNIVGINSRLDELQARLLAIKLGNLNEWNEERMEIAGWYESQLESIDLLQVQASYKKAVNVRHIFPILTEKRDELQKYLLSQGIETLIHYEKPVHFHTAFSFLEHEPGDFPDSEKVCSQELSLPTYPGLKKKEVDYKKCLKNN